MNQCIHGIDLLRWMMGDEVEEIYAQTARQFHDYLECEDVGMAVIKFKNGALGTIEGTTNVFPKNLEETLYIFGENGTVQLAGQSCNTVNVWQFSDSQPCDINMQNGFHETVENVYGNGHTLLYTDMIQSINMNKSPYIDAKAGKNALETVLAIYQSKKTGNPVHFPLKNFSSIDMKGTF